jgi:diadenosine tetraphosphatase ApaH/serine/threonine PP2A family protein phosphatase
MPSKRGVGVAFGQDITERFLAANGLELLIRSHECKDEGYEVEHGGKTITVERREWVWGGAESARGGLRVGERGRERNMVARPSRQVGG